MTEDEKREREELADALITLFKWAKEYKGWEADEVIEIVATNFNKPFFDEIT